MVLTISAKSVGKFFMAVAIALTLAHLGWFLAASQSDNKAVQAIFALFRLDAEHNVPALWSAATLACCGAILALIARVRSRMAPAERFYWWGMTLILLFLAADEALALHERMTSRLRALLRASGPFYYAWVIPYGLAMVALIAAYARFLWHLPRRSRALVCLAGVIYVAGAMACEMVGGMIAQTRGTESLAFVMAYTCEELLEMSGVALLAYALLDYLARLPEPVALAFGSTIAPAGRKECS